MDGQDREGDDTAMLLTDRFRPGAPCVALPYLYTDTKPDPAAYDDAMTLSIQGYTAEFASG